MPKVSINPVELWFPPSNTPRRLFPPLEQQFTFALYFELPAIVAGAMASAFGERVDHRTVVPHIVGPNRFPVEGITPDIDMVVMPNWTLRRWDYREPFLDALVEELAAARERIVAKSEVKLPEPQIDIDVDYIVGPGCALAPDGEITSRWPRKDT